MNLAGKTALWAGAAVGAYVGWRVAERAVVQARHRGIAQGKRIVILGGGFGGMYAARELARLLPDADNGELILIDANDYLLFTPLLTEAAGGEIRAAHITSPVEHLPRRIRFLQGRVVKVDLATKTVTVRKGENAEEEALRADQLVIALGSVTNYHHLPGVQEHSHSMRTLSDAQTVYGRALALLEEAAHEPDEQRRRALLTIVVGGGGYTGVETMAALNDLVRDQIRRYPQLQPAEIRTILVEPTERLLMEITPDLAAYAQRKLQERCVEVLLKTGITGAGDGYVELADGRRIPTHLLVWSAGVMPSPVTKHLDCPHGPHGGVVVDAACAVPNHPGVWALGDCAEIPQPHGKGPYAPTAQNATREGEHVARNIVASLRGEPPRPFVYTPIGELALVGKRVGVARVYEHNFSGLLAWAMWRGVYLAKMPNPAQQVHILTDWVLDAALGQPVATLPAPTLAERT